MKKTLFFVAVTMLAALAFTSCKKDNKADNPLVGNWVMIGNAQGYASRFTGVEEYFNIQNDGKMVQYSYNGQYTESIWDNGVLTGENWIARTTYTWKCSGNTIFFTPKFWGVDKVQYKLVNNDILEIEGMVLGRAKKVVSTKQ